MCNASIEHRQHRHWSTWSASAKIGVAAAVVFGIPSLVAVCGLVTMWLWNELMPVIFKLPAIGFWQAIGLLALSHILFKGGVGHRAARSHWRKRQVWRHMQESTEGGHEHA